MPGEPRWGREALRGADCTATTHRHNAPPRRGNTATAPLLRVSASACPRAKPPTNLEIQPPFPILDLCPATSPIRHLFIYPVLSPYPINECQSPPPPTTTTSPLSLLLSSSSHPHPSTVEQSQSWLKKKNKIPSVSTWAQTTMRTSHSSQHGPRTGAPCPRPRRARWCPSCRTAARAFS